MVNLNTPILMAASCVDERAQVDFPLLVNILTKLALNPAGIALGSF